MTWYRVNKTPCQQTVLFSLIIHYINTQLPTSVESHNNETEKNSKHATDVVVHEMHTYN